MYIWTRRLYWEYYICMNACMYVCIMYVCVSVLQSARHSARRSLIGALIGALCAVEGNFLGCAPCAKPCTLLGVQFQCRSRAFTRGSLVCARSRVSWFLCESLYNRSFIPGVKLPRHLTRAEADSLVTLCVSESYDSRQRQR